MPIMNENHLRAMDIRAVAAALVLLVAAGCDSSSDRPDPARVEALESRQAAFLAALADGNAEQVASFFADDAVVHVANMPAFQGREAIQRLYENVFGHLTSADYQPERMHLAASADLAYGAGQVTTTFGDQSFPGKYLLIWQRTEDQWQVVAYAISNTQAGPSSP